MAGSIIVSSITLDSDNNFSIKSNTGATLFFANTTGIDVANSIGATAITNDKILSVANTKISGNIISSQITSVANTQISGNIASSQITSNPTLYGNVSVTGVIGVGGATPSTSGAGITFPATQSASSNANTLDDYQEGSYTGTLTGCTTTPTTTVYYTKIGNIVHLSNLAASITGTSNTNALRITGMPALIRPANTSKAAVQGGINGSASQTIWVQILSNGDFYCEQGGGSWTTSGVKGFDSGFGITYSTV